MIADRVKNMMTLRRDSTARSDLTSWSRRRRLGSLWLIVAMGIGLSWLSFTRARNTEESRVRSEFESASERVIAELVGSLELDDSFLRSLGSFFDASIEVTREEFAAFANPALAQPLSFQALAWLPRVTHAERLGAEAAARKHYPNYRIQEVSPSGQLVTAEWREEYFPVYYAEPLQGNEAALGLDLSSDPDRREALQSAWTTGEPRATKILELIRPGYRQKGFLIFFPIFEHQGRPTGPSEMAGNLRGFVVGILEIDKLAANALERLGSENHSVELQIVDSANDLERTGLLSDRDGLGNTRSPFGKPVIRDIFVAGQTWAAVSYPGTDPAAAPINKDAWLFLWSGIALTILMSWYAFMLMARAARYAEFAQRLTGAEELYRLVVETMRDGLIILDKDGVLTYVNDRFCEITGLARREFIGQPATKFLDAENRSKVEQEFGNRKTQERSSYEIQWRKVNGDQVSAIVGPSTVVDARGEFCGSIATLTDVTELKLAETKAREAMQAKGDFLATISHEMRTPLNGIIGMSRLLLRSGLPEQERSYAALLESSTDSLLHLINSILDFSKIEAGKTALEAMNFSIEDSLTEVNAILGPRAAAKGIDLRFETLNELGACVGDPLRVRQIMLNIVGNAIKFTEDGYVEVSAERVAREEDRVGFRITVRDTGIGIPAEAQRMIFGSFTQAETSTTRLFGGTGLGLAISKRLVELMGGEIGVESNEDGGASFWFTITLAERTDNPQQQTSSKILAGTSARSRSREGFHILVAEDNEVNRLVALRELEYLGYRATAVCDGVEVLKALQQSNYDLILMDCQMPNLDGFETTGKIRSSEDKDRRIPIVAATAYAMKDDVKRCLAAGMDDYISKPLETDQLRQVVDRWLSIQVSGAEVGKPAREVRSEPQTGINLRALQHLRDVAGDEGRDTVKAIIEAFLEQLPVFLEDFHRLHSSSDSEGLSKALHSLCGASGTIGAFHLSDLCRRVEEDLQSGSYAALPNSLDPIYEEIGSVQDSLREVMIEVDSGTA